MKKIIKLALDKLGYKIQKAHKSQSENSVSNNLEFSMEGALSRCVSRGLNINSVIDVGASNGQWSKMCSKYLPNARYLMIEAQEEHKKDLEDFILKNTNTDYILAAAGNKNGKIYFDNGDLFGGLASETPFKENCIEVPVITIDSEIEKRSLKPPYLIKLDTHGFEVPILEGARDALKHAELIIIETYNYKLAKDSLKFYQICNYMEDLGFYPIEMVDFLLRRFDNSFWQMDTFFIPSKRKEFDYNSYQ